ncbi:MAG: ABC transporter ATP-binding protein [Candidatus Lokiarchaeota archaeon]|nr:ABC transporter ATP-binding protein [Candidatus Lokiarchaeota archaeon]
MGLYAGMMNEGQKREYKDRELFIRYVKRVSPFRKNILLIALFIFVSSIAEILNPLVIGMTVDELSKSNSNLSVVLSTGGIYLLLSILLWIMFFLRRKEIGKFVPSFLENLRMDIFDKLQEQDMSFFDKHLSGRLNTRVSNDALEFGNTTLLLADTLGNLLISLLTFGMILWLNKTLALISLIALPFILILVISLRRLVRIVSRAYRKAIGDINSAMVESIEGIHVCKSYGQESTVAGQFHEINKGYFKASFRITSITHMWRPLLETIASVTLILVIFYGGQLVFQGISNPGTIFMFILYLQKFFRPIMVLSVFFPQLSSGMAAYERILDILDSEPRVKQNPNATDVGLLEGEIEIKDLDFCYREGEWVFNGLDLHIKKGEKLAIVGQTGAGKSSLVSLLTRYYEFQGGSIEIDSVNIRDMTLESFRRNLGTVQQDIFLFSGTIEENIRYGRRDASEEDLWRAIKIVHLEELIEYLPEGLQTQIGERGKGLSAGQQQLISFARAILIDPRILILDEATSSVDAYTEAIIQEALEVLLSNRTSIIIAHRLSTIVNADRIIVMENGQIVEEGTHKSLLTQEGKYAKLYKQYFEHQSLDWEPSHVSLKIK